jgi:hypothetical protein
VENILREPVELTQAELDVVAGGTHRHSLDIDVDIGNFVSQVNASFNQTSTGNNNNGVSGNQVAN